MTSADKLREQVGPYGYVAGEGFNTIALHHGHKLDTDIEPPLQRRRVQLQVRVRRASGRGRASGAAPTAAAAPRREAAPHHQGVR